MLLSHSGDLGGELREHSDPLARREGIPIRTWSWSVEQRRRQRRADGERRPEQSFTRKASRFLGIPTRSDAASTQPSTPSWPNSFGRGSNSSL